MARTVNHAIGFCSQLSTRNCYLSALNSELAESAHNSRCTDHPSQPLRARQSLSRSTPAKEPSMGRSAAAQTQQNINQQLSQQNAMNQQIYGSSQSLGSQAAAGYQNLLANPGYSQAQQSAITNASQSALASSFNALAQNAANTAARTRNSAGYGELIDSLAQTQGQ